MSTPDRPAHQHQPGRKRANTLKPLATPGALGTGSSSTPRLNAAKSARLRDEKAARVKPAGYVSADMVRALSASHPARLAYTNNAYRGMAAAQQAYHEAMKTAA